MKVAKIRSTLATASTLKGIQRYVQRFYCSASWVVNPQTLVLEHPVVKTPEKTRVEPYRGGFRFVSLAN